jgi:hypothetical protein
MSTDKFISSTEDLVGKTEAPKNMRSKSLISHVSARMFILLLLSAIALAQNPPNTGDPYVSRGNPKSPDGSLEWTVRTTNPIHYELVNLPEGKALAAVNAYYPEANRSNIRYAKAYGVFWNEDGTVVALDELNRRRAGHLYFFILHNGTVREVRAENIFSIPASADEGRVVVDPGWVSRTKIQVRQALKTKTGEFVSRYYTVDFANPDDVKILPGG